MSEAALFQVSLTGKRLAAVADDAIVTKLMLQFRVDESRARALLGSRRVIKRELRRELADRLVVTLEKLGLEAIVEPVRAAQGRAPHQDAAAQVKQGPSALERLAALGGQRLPTPKVTSVYAISLAAVTVLCIVMPLLYLGLTAAAAYSWFWYLTEIHHYINLRDPRLLLLVYGAPGLMGLVLVLFLLKPLLTLPPRRPRPVVIDPEREKEFVQGIHALCRAIGTAPPKEIHLTWDVNAWVHFRSGLFSLFTGHKVLTIGLPLMAGMTARQFVGVLAHEFGHFSQRLGMRCSYVINTVNAWLEFRAYGEDAWDHRLRQWLDESDNGLVDLVILVTQAGIGMTRLLMKLMFQVSFRMSRHLSRQMEFDADRYEALVAGSDGFRTTARNLRGLALAFHEVNKANAEAWGDGRLLRNLPQAAALQFATFDAKRLQLIEQSMGDEETRYWDSHPADLDRIENAERRNCPGVYRDERPASALMHGFAAACERVTGAFYSEQGVRYNQTQLRAAEEILSLTPTAEERPKHVDGYFNGQFQSLPLMNPGLMKDEHVAHLDWQATIDQLRARSPEIARDWGQAWEVEQSRPRFVLALQLGLRPSQVALTGGDDRPPALLREEYERICAQKTPCHERTRVAMALYMRRLRCAGDTLAAGERGRFAALLRLMQSLYAAQQMLRELLELQALTRELERMLQAGMAVSSELTAARSRHHATGTSLLAAMEKVPQELVEGETVAGWLRLRHPRLAESLDDITRFQRGASGLPGSLLHLYRLLLDQLTEMAIAAEKANGIRPIKIVLVKMAP